MQRAVMQWQFNLGRRDACVRSPTGGWLNVGAARPGKGDAHPTLELRVVGVTQP